jgi:hypothetical protein
MADEPENHTLRLLREMRDDIKEIKQRFGDVDRRFDALQTSHNELAVEAAAMRTDQHRTNELLETVAKTQQNQGARLNAIDGRLALIEQRIGMVGA